MLSDLTSDESSSALAALLANTPKSIKVDARDSRTSHTRTVHTLSRKEILCKACVDKMDKFTFVSSFLASHNDIIDRLCDTCQEEFPRVSYRVYHIEMDETKWL